MEPLFAEDIEEVQQRLRLSGIPQGQDAEAMLHEAMSTVRANFLIELSPGRVAELAAQPLNREATTSAEMIRLLAATIETKWIMHELLCVMPVRFAEGTSELQSWNEEGIWRDKTPELIQQLRDKLFNDIQRGLEILREGGAVDGAGINVSVIGPVTAPPAPGEFLDLDLLNYHYEDC